MTSAIVGHIKHEMMHTLGFYHEHSRSDRDQYIKVNWEHISDGNEAQFLTYRWANLFFIHFNLKIIQILTNFSTNFTIGSVKFFLWLVEILSSRRSQLLSYRLSIRQAYGCTYRVRKKEVPESTICKIVKLKKWMVSKLYLRFHPEKSNFCNL